MVEKTGKNLVKRKNGRFQSYTRKLVKSVEKVVATVLHIRINKIKNDNIE